jgi:hypothetical protein
VLNDMGLTDVLAQRIRVYPWGGCGVR